MKKHIMTKCLMIITILFFAMLLMIQTGNAEVTEEGRLYICSFPITVKINGDFSDWPANIVWQKVTHDMGWNVPDNDEDASFEFACVADNDYLYVGAKIRDDRRIVGEDIGNEVCMDDSIEIYIDGDNSKAKEYESDVSQITIGRYNAGRDPAKPILNSWTGMNRLGKPASQAGIIAAVVDLDFVWAVETVIPLNAFGIKLEDGKTVGFNVKLNDDDDGGDRDHALGWSKIERQDDDSAYKDHSVFGELKFAPKK